MTLLFRDVWSSSGRFPNGVTPLNRDRRGTYFQAYAAASPLYFGEARWLSCTPDNTKTWTEFKVPARRPSAVSFMRWCAAQLSHHVVIRKGKIANYHPYPPTPWNANPRDSYGTLGLMRMRSENTLIFEETGLDKFESGIDIMRNKVRSFDPCLPCGVHMYLGKGKTLEVRHATMFGAHK